MKRTVVAATGLAVVVAGLGYAHSRVRKSTATCPMGFSARTPEQRAAARRALVQQHAGQAPARKRSALGWTLDATTRADVNAWATQHGVSCAARSHSTDLECTVPETSDLARDSAPLTSVWLAFGANDTLEHVTAFRASASADDATRAFTGLVTTLERDVGTVTRKGDASSKYLARGALNQATAELGCADYAVKLSVTNMGTGGFTIVDEYRAF